MWTTDRRRRPIVAVLGAILALIALVGPAAAGPAKSVTIISHVTFNPGDWNYGDFDASGAAADGGLICAHGTFVDTNIEFHGYQSDRGVVQLRVDKHFTCNTTLSGPNGTFDVKLQIQANIDTGIETFSWVVKGGTGDLSSLRGAGRGSTVLNPPTGNINTYEGMLTR